MQLSIKFTHPVITEEQNHCKGKYCPNMRVSRTKTNKIKELKKAKKPRKSYKIAV